MKAEERHELHENVLAKWLEKLLQHSQSYLTLLAGGLIVFALVSFGWKFLESRKEAKRSLGWSEVLFARDAESLEKVAQRHPGTLAGAWAMQKAGDQNLHQGAHQLYEDFRKAEDHFEKARDAYAKAIEMTQDATLLQHAHFGAAQSYESLRGFAKAKEHYEAITKSWPQSAIAKLAEERIQRLDDPATLAFFDWYFQQDPPNRDAGVGGLPSLGGVPGGKIPSMDVSLPTQPDIQLPTALDGTASDPTGSDPTGSDPTGSDPTGSDPTGSDPTGGPDGADPVSDGSNSPSTPQN